MARVEPTRHFYLPGEVAWDNIKALQERYAQGFVTVYTNRHAWESILRVYFPQRRSIHNIDTVIVAEHAENRTGTFRCENDGPKHSHYDPSLLQLQPSQTAQGTMYCVLGDHFDQGPDETDRGIGGSATVQRIVTDLPARIKHNRDILYVKCSPPGDNGAQSQWHKVMQAAVGRLRQRYANHALFFILGVGMEWLPFYWDPHSPAPTGQALRMVADGAVGESGGEAASGWYGVGPEVRAPPGVDAGHVDAEGVVHTGRARSLDCFTVAPQRAAGEVPGLACKQDLDFLEEFIGVVERHDYIGENDPNAE